MQQPQFIPAARIIQSERVASHGIGWRLGAGLVAVALALSLAMPTAVRAAGKDLPLVEQVRDGRWSPGWGEPEDWGKHGKKRRIPSVCAIEIGSDMRMFSGNCMDREGLRAKLPRGCATSARIFGQRDQLYRAGCLRDAGFDLPRRN